MTRLELKGHIQSKATQKLSEKVVTKQVCDFMRAHRWRAIRLQSGLFSRPLSQSRVRIGEPGMPDWLFIRKHPTFCNFTQCLFVEIKAPGKRPTVEQEQWAESAIQDGFDVRGFDSLEKCIEHCKVYYPD